MRKFSIKLWAFLAAVVAVAVVASVSAVAASYHDLKCDVVIVNGRVMDPLSRFDEIATVGIKDGQIAAITSERGATASLRARAEKVIDASGLIVAPGFINIHGHEGVIRDSLAYGALDGITT